MTHLFLSPALLAAGLIITALTAMAWKSAEERLKFITSAMNSLPDIVFYKNVDGVYCGGNKAWASLTGKPLEELIGKTDFDLFPHDVAQSFRSRDQEMLASGESRSNQEWLVYPDGKRVLVKTVKTPWVSANGEILGVLGTCYEIDVPATAPSKENTSE